MIRMLQSLVALMCVISLSSVVRGDDLVASGDFEQPADGPAATIAGWRRRESTPQSAYRVRRQSSDGRWALFIKSDPAKGSQVVEQRLRDYVPGQRYEVVFEACTAKPAGAFHVVVLDLAAAKKALLASSDLSSPKWALHAVGFTAPKEPGHPLLLRFSSAALPNDSAVSIDNVRVVPLSKEGASFRAARDRMELDTFNALTRVAFELGAALDVVQWRIKDLAACQAVASDKLGPMLARAQDLDRRLQAETRNLESMREKNFFPGIVLSLTPDSELVRSTKQLEDLGPELAAATKEVQGALDAEIAGLCKAVDALAGGWQPPAERTADYSPRMLNDRFHRIMSYHGFMPASEYLLRAMWELRPTAIQGYCYYRNYERTKINRSEFFKYNRPRTIPYIEAVAVRDWFDLSRAKETIDRVFQEIGAEPSFAGVEFEEPRIADEDVQTSAGYVEFRRWLAARYQGAVAGFPLADALKWERPAKLESRMDQVLWMELQQFKAYWFARQLKALQDYTYGKSAKAVAIPVIQQFLPTQPQRASYATTSAAMDWVAMDPYNSANVGEAFLMDLLRSNSKGPNLLVVGTCYDRTSGRFAKDMAISFAHCGGLWNWCWVYLAKRRVPSGVVAGAWPMNVRGYWKEGMYEAAQEMMGKMAAIEPYLLHTATAANVGLVYSERTGIACSLPDSPAYYINNLGIYQALEQLHVPVEALFAESMTPAKLACFKTLILADADCLREEEIRLLEAWCRRGGSLIALGGVGVRDQWGGPQENYGGFTDLFGVKRGKLKTGAKHWELSAGKKAAFAPSWPYDLVEPMAATVQVIGRFDSGDIAAIRNTCGQGNVYLLAGHNLGQSFDGSKSTKGLYKDYWPGFAENLRKLVGDALKDAHGSLPVEAENAPRDVEVALRRQGDRLVVHLLNYADQGPVRGMTLVAQGRGGQRAFCPAESKDLAAIQRGLDLAVAVPEFEHHTCIVIEPRQTACGSDRKGTRPPRRL